jgi:hypothetical protein
MAALVLPGRGYLDFPSVFQTETAGDVRSPTNGNDFGLRFPQGSTATSTEPFRPLTVREDVSDLAATLVLRRPRRLRPLMARFEDQLGGLRMVPPWWPNDRVHGRSGAFALDGTSG